MLAEARPDDAVLSEESKDDPVRLERERVWIVDPLDGTREYGESGRIDWAVHVALVVGGTPQRLRGRAPRPGAARAVDRESSGAAGPARRAVATARVAHAPAASSPSSSPSSSTPSSCRWVRRARRRWPSCKATADVYAHSGGQYEWDSAAPVGVAAAAGCHTLAARRLAASSTTGPTRTCPTCSCAAPSLPTPSSLRSAAAAGR